MPLLFLLISFQSCLPGYYRVDGILFGGICQPCKCNGHATECDTQGVCFVSCPLMRCVLRICLEIRRTFCLWQTSLWCMSVSSYGYKLCITLSFIVYLHCMCSGDSSKLFSIKDFISFYHFKCGIIRSKAKMSTYTS